MSVATQSQWAPRGRAACAQRGPACGEQRPRAAPAICPGRLHRSGCRCTRARTGSRTQQGRPVAQFLRFGAGGRARRGAHRGSGRHTESPAPPVVPPHVSTSPRPPLPARVSPPSSSPAPPRPPPCAPVSQPSVLKDSCHRPPQGPRTGRPGARAPGVCPGKKGEAAGQCPPGARCGRVCAFMGVYGAQRACVCEVGGSGRGGSDATGSQAGLGPGAALFSPRPGLDTLAVHWARGQALGPRPEMAPCPRPSAEPLGAVTHEQAVTTVPSPQPVSLSTAAGPSGTLSLGQELLPSLGQRR